MGEQNQNLMVALAGEVRELSTEMKAIVSRLTRIEQTLDNERLIVRMDRLEQSQTLVIARLSKGDDQLAMIGPIARRVEELEHATGTHEVQISAAGKAQAEQDTRVKTLEKEAATRKWFQSLVISAVITNLVAVLFLVIKWAVAYFGVFPGGGAGGGGP